jgi:hypothetical protein
MQDNPYQSNTTSPSLASDTTSVQFREFTGKTFSFRFSQKQIRNEIRALAQLAIEHEIGTNNVINIIEHSPYSGAFSVVVWYRS